MPIQAGSRLGPYELLAPIGAGGMGEVWRGKDTRLDRSVAVKILPAAFAEDEERRQRFEREAKAISSLNHPHICTLFDVGHEGDAHRPFRVELVPPPEIAVAPVVQGALALAPDGMRMAFVAGGDTRSSLVVRDLATGESKRLAGTDVRLVRSWRRLVEE